MTGVLRELWQHRDLALILGWRELVVRYKRSVVGVAWALAEPLMLVTVYVVVFGYVLGVRQGLPNYVLFALQGVLCWTFFASTLEQATTTLLEHSALLKKSYFPWEILLLGVIASRLSTLLIGLMLVMPLSLLIGDPEHVAWQRVFLVPLGVAAILSLTLGLAMILAPLHVILADTQFLVRFVLRIAFFLSPIVYPLAQVPDSIVHIYALNPIVGVLWLFQGFTNASLPELSTAALLSSMSLCVALPFFGWWAFRRLHWYVADLL